MVLFAAALIVVLLTVTVWLVCALLQKRWGQGVREDFFNACLGPDGGDLRYTGLGVRSVPRKDADALPKVGGARSPQDCADACARQPISACGGFAWVGEKCALLKQGPPAGWMDYAPASSAQGQRHTNRSGETVAFVGTRVPDYVDQRYAKVTNHVLVVTDPVASGGKKALPDEPGANPSARSCADACNTDPDCGAFLFDGKARACWTFNGAFNDDVPPAIAPGVVSGQRALNAGDCGA